MSKSRHKKWFEYPNENDYKEKNWRKKREARKMKAKVRSKNLEYREEEEEDSNLQIFKS